MSLATAVLEIADQMVGDIDVVSDPVVKVQILNYARQLRSAVKASEGSSFPIIPIADGKMLNQPSPEEVQLRKQLAQASELEEQTTGFRMVEVADGPMGSTETTTMIQIDSKMPERAKMFIGKEVYQLREDRLYHCEEDTKKARGIS